MKPICKTKSNIAFNCSIVQKQFTFTFLKITHWVIIAFLVVSSQLMRAQNPIVTENALTGNPSSEWDVNGSGDLSIQGFAQNISVNTGATVNFKVDVKAPATNFTIKIYRIGYYNNKGARLITNLGSFTGVAQPAPLYEVATGKTDCNNWSVSASWNTAGAVSGVYLAKLTRTDNGGASHIVFVVRNDSSNSAILFKTSDTTWQAYNNYGGNSLYVNNSGISVPGYNHATKVSYNRPFYTRNGGGGGGVSEDFVFNAEYPMIRWMERNGYDVSYTTAVDMDKDLTPITTSMHKVMLSVGHDEYWSVAERNKFETARANGVHLAFFSGNEVYWKTRWEDNHQTLVCFKEGTEGENVCGGKCDTSTNIWTGLWRDGNVAQYPGSDGGSPENALSGQISWAEANTSIQVPAAYKNYRFWRNTSVASLGTGQTATFPEGTLGYEWDFEQFENFYPTGRITMSKTTVGSSIHKLSLYRHASGALVFGAGTVQWSWGLDSNHDRGNEAPSQDMQQATINLFADMGVQPANLQPGLSPATASTDVAAPVCVITFPANGGTAAANNPITVSGTASDVQGIVAAVEVSLDGGSTWKTASGTTNWSFTFTPSTPGPLTIKAHAVDDSCNIGLTGTVPSANAITITITEPVAPICPCTIWNPETVPVNITENDPTALELGIKFRPKADGFITGIRFYKSAANTGVHIGNLWTLSGTNLAQATFSAETASGWQEVIFNNPVAVTTGTTYVASYHTNSGYYSQDVNVFTSPVETYYLTVLADGTDGDNGVYAESDATTFPTSGYQASNYYVDVIFNLSTLPDVTSPVVISVAPANNSAGAAITTHPTALFNESILPASANVNSVLMAGPGNISIPGSVSCAGGSVTFTPASSLAYTTTYTLTLKGGLGANRISDNAGNLLAADYSWSFTTSQAPPPPPTEGPGGPILVISAASNPFSRYPVEILRAEGLNEFTAMDLSLVNTAILNNHDVVILGEINVNSSQVAMLTTWVNAGGTLITFRPNALLAPLLGITSASGSLSDKYLLFNTTNGPGVGLVDQTIQFHGTADYYTLGTATSLATLYSNAGAATTYPAVTTNNVGANGGKAIAFTYDLPKSIIYTRQGNPAWIGQERDGQSDNIRSSDLFFPDWIDLNKVAIPQADEQQRMLTNIILKSNLHRKPLPRFWFLPRKLKAAIVMTGDDHGSGGTVARFNQYLGYGNNTATDVLNWNAVRGTSYIYTSTPISNAQAAAFNAQGFEIALHLNTNCGGYNLSSLGGYFSAQMPAFTSKYTSLPAPTTNRTHCISWSDWASKPKVELANGIRLNTDYYYYPAAWIQNRPGMFTGSGMPMRFADIDGTIIDNYQVTTQMPDESGISFPGFVNTLLDNAVGNLGYYGVFCANMHTDAGSSPGSDAIIASAQARQIPVISAKQMLTWLDGRNASAFSAIALTGNNLNFTVSVGSGANQLQGMVPMASETGQLTGITLNGAPIAYTSEGIKGINYAFFDANPGNYTATYFTDNTAPIINNIIATPGLDGSVTITWTTNELSNSTINFGTTSGTLNLTSLNATLTTSHSITLNGLSLGTQYFYTITSADGSSNTATAPPTGTLNFIMPSGPCVSENTAAHFSEGTLLSTFISPKNDGEVSLNPAAGATFSQAGIPASWQSFAWTGGTSSISSGILTVNGSRFNTVSPTATCAPGSVMEFVATFGAAAFQHIGFGGGNDAVGTGGIFNGESAWAMFSTGSTTSQLQARTFLGSAGPTNINIGAPGAYTGSAHLYRIEWKATSVVFYIDGVLVNSTNTTITGTMRPAISDYNNAAPGIAVDWILASPYAASGTYQSKIHDAGVVKTWGIASWTADVPAGTTLQMAQRQSNSPVDILTAPWTAIVSNGANIGGTSRYIQYKADFATSNTALTSVLKDFSLTCAAPQTAAPVVTLHPNSQTKCSGEPVSFVSASTGNPIATVQWQRSVDGGATWTDIASATNPTYTLTAAIGDNGKKFKAVWNNTVGAATSTQATLTVNPLPTATISAVNGSICPGGTIALQLSAATGTGPYSLVVNGTTYPNINAGQTFATFSQQEISIWGATGTPANPSVTDNLPIEVGVKFRSTVSGYITGIRFYKGLTNTGAHTAHLWATNGTLLATAIFTAESASGWQEVRFANAIVIQANTTYIASYLSQGGYFAISSGFFAGSGVTNGPLTALQSGTDGINGVYKYGGGFPDGGNTANYWVDVLFSQVTNTFTGNLTAITDQNGCTSTGSPLSTVTVTTNPLPSGAIVPVANNVCQGGNINLVFNATLGNGPFALTINGNTYPNIISGTPFLAGSASMTPTNTNLWSGVAGAQNVDNVATELGVKIKSTIPGTITGIRFYKHGNGVQNFTGSLWAEGNTTTPLATANYTTDNSPGWKEITFAVPVQITANTNYMASYFSASPNYYAFTANGLAAPFVNGPLTAMGCYYKQPGSGYPNNSSTANYWVDVLFQSNSSNSNFNLTAIVSASGCSTTGIPLSSTVVTVAARPTPTFVAAAGASTCGNTEITYTTQSGQSTYAWTISGTLNIDYAITSGDIGSTNHTVTLKWLTAGQKVIAVNYNNAAGCPGTNAATSTTTVHAIPTANTTSQTACDSYTWPVTGLTYENSGTFSGTSTNSNGCIVNETLLLTINESTSSTVSVSANGSYTWPLNGMTYSASGTYTFIGTNATGCALETTLLLTIITNIQSVISGSSVICNGMATNLSVTISGGTPPFNVVYTDGNSNFTVNGYVSGNGIVINPTANCTYTLVSVTDANQFLCGTNNGAAVITVNQKYPFYVDGDSDGVGSGTVTNLCATNAATPPTGFSLSNTDCNDANPLVYQSAMLFVDADNDGYQNGASATNVCYGADVPVGFTVNSGVDCNDANDQAFPGHGEVGYNLVDDDCDGLVDEGYPIKATVMQSAQCNTILPAIDTQLYANLVAGAQGYRWRITTLGINDAVVEVQEINTLLRVLKLTQLSHYAFNTKYKVEVAVYFAGFLQPYAASDCTVTTPAAKTSLLPCGQTLTAMSDVIYAGMVPFATGYRFEITEVGNASHTQTIDRALREFRMNLITAFTVRFGKTFNVKISVRNTDGSYLPYGPVCTVSTPLFPSISLQDTQCNNYAVPNYSTQMYAYSYPGAISYVFNLSLGLPEAGVEVTKYLRAFTLNDFAGMGLIPGAIYNVRVRIIFNTADPAGPYGKTCTIVIPGSSRHIESAALPFDAVASPNPFTNDFNIKVSSLSTSNFNIKVYDMLGRLLETRNVKAAEMESCKVGERYPAGVYNVFISQGEETKTLRVVKR